MKIEEIRLRWFRGASEESVLRTGGKSVVVYGPNASGKSCFTDALEYVLSGGRIGHLAHEYSGHYQQRGVRNTHAPEGQEAQVEIVFDGDHRVRADIAEQGTHTLSGHPDDETLGLIDGWHPRELILRQDGLVAFIGQRKGERYSALVPLFGLEPLEAAATNLGRLRQDIRTRSGLDSDRQKAGRLAAEGARVFGSTGDDAVRRRLEELWSRYSQEEKPDDLPSLIERLAQAVADHIERVEPEQRLLVRLEAIHSEVLNDKVADAIAKREIANTLVDDLLDAKLPILQRAELFIQALPAGQADVNCPACGRDISTESFREHVQDEIGALSDALASRNAAEEARSIFVQSLRNVRQGLRDQQVSEWIGGTEVSDSAAALLEADAQTFAGGTDLDPMQRLRPHVDAIQACLADKIKIAPPAVAGLLEDRDTIAFAQRLHGLGDIEASCQRVETLLAALESCEGALRDGIGRRTQEVMEDISGDIQRLWSTLHPDERITDVQLTIPEDADKAIDIVLTFHGKPQPSPRNTLSEGHRNSLGLCIFLALLLREGRRGWPLILDDVVSSFDRDHRGLLVDVLTQHFSDRQVIIFTHDREWFAELRRLLPQAQWRFARLGIWQGPESGLQVTDAADTFEEALEWISTNPEFASTKARAVMDRELAAAAERLRLPMPFLGGERNDHRMATEFLERLISEAPQRLKRKDGDAWVAADEPVASWRETRDLLIAWANRDTHGGVGAVGESQRLIESCRASLQALSCPGECGRLIGQHDDRQQEVLYCVCGRMRWKYG